MLVRHRLAMAADQVDREAEFRREVGGGRGERLAHGPVQPRQLQRPGLVRQPQPRGQRLRPGHGPRAQQLEQPGLARGHAADRDVDPVHRGAADQAGDDALRCGAHVVQADASRERRGAHSRPGKAPPSISRFCPVM